MRSSLQSIMDRRMLIVLLMGFSSGIPLLLVDSTLKAWMTDQRVDLAVIGIFSLVQLPYTLKFLWAPILDRYDLFGIGRRKSWLLVSQICLALGLLAMSFAQPHDAVGTVAVLAMLVAFFSATQDTVVDAYRRETLENNELGLGSSLYVTGYRIAILFSGAFALYLADRVAWATVYRIMAASMAVGFLTTLFSPEPDVPRQVRSIRLAFIEPLSELLTRKNIALALTFVILYKIGESMASTMYMPFYLHAGFTKTQVGEYGKMIGLAAVIAGGLVGGVLQLRYGMFRSLLAFGILQGVALLGFSWLASGGPNVSHLAMVIGGENFTSGMATSAYLAFLMCLCDKRYTGTQYAVLSSLMGIPRVLAGAPTGWMAKELGWPMFFVICTAITIPGLLLLFRVNRTGLLEDTPQAA